MCCWSKRLALLFGGVFLVFLDFTVVFSKAKIVLAELCFSFLPGYNESHSMPALFSHNGDDRGKAFHTWHTQNAAKKEQILLRVKETS